MPKLSIITVNLNNAKGLQKTIESVINQTFTDYEYIIIDGGSTDDSKEIIEKYADKITYWVSEPDKGIYNGMNKGIKISAGEWVYLLNSGDWFYNDDVLNDIFKRNINVAIIYGNVFFEKDKIIHAGKFNQYKLMWKNICHQSIFFKKTIFKEIGFFNEKYKIVADWEHNIKWFTNRRIKQKYLNSIIANYEQGGISQNTDMEFIKDRKYIFKKHINIFYRQISNYRKYFPINIISNFLLK